MQNEAEDGKPPPKLDEVGSFEEKITQLESQAAFTSRLILEMPCVRFNQYIKEHGLSDKEVKEMKEARRRMKKRLYTKRSRERKITKLDEVGSLEEKITQLESQAAFTSSPAVQAVLAAAGLVGGAMAASVAKATATVAKTDDGHMEITQAGEK